MRKTTKSALKGLYSLFLLSIIVASSIDGMQQSTLAQTETFDQHLTKGKDALEKGDYPTAYWELESARIKEPDRAEPYILLATLRIREDRPDEAIEKAETGIKFQPANATLHYLLARSLWIKQNYERSVTEIESAYKLGERSGDFYVLMCEIMLSPSGRKLLSSVQQNSEENIKGAYSQVLSRFEEALEILPSNDPQRPLLEKKANAVRALQEFGSYHGDLTFQCAMPTTNGMPNYTAYARRHKVHGTVHLAVFVSATGEVDEAVVLVSLGYGLDEESVKCVKSVKWTPATKDGKPISSCVRMNISYSLL